MSRGIPSLGQWSAKGQTQTQGTPIVIGIPPWPVGQPRFLYDRSTKNWLSAAGGGGAVTHVTSLIYTTSSTDLKTPTILRPLNWTYITTAAAAAATTLVMFDDPGVYSTNFRYPLGGGQTAPSAPADNAAAASDYVAVQLADGSWHFTKVTSISTLTLTITTALPSPTTTTGGVAAGAVLFFFGAAGDTDPNTNAAHPNFQPQASATLSMSDPSGLCSAVHPGDPLLLVDANATSAGTVVTLAGYFGKY